MKNKESVNKEKKKGAYSVNKTIFSFLIFTLLFVFITSSDLYSKSSHVENIYIRTILTSILKPIDNLARKVGVTNLFNQARQKVLSFSKLNKELEWEEFYYTENNIQEEIVKKIEKEENRKKPMGREKPLKKKKLYEEQLLEEVPVIEDLEGEGEEIKEIEEISPYLYDENKPFRLLMVGDSQMYSVANGLKKLTIENKAIEITDIAIHSSGFIRGDYYNWEKKLENVFKEREAGYYQASVILLGMNDYQDIYTYSSFLLRETKEWEEKYKERIMKVLNVLLLNTKKVYWLGMPLVRRATYNDDLRYIDKIQKEIADEYNQPNLQRISIASIAPGDGVPYTDTIQKEDGTIIRLMKADGIHYTAQGGEYVMEGFLKELYITWFIKPNMKEEK
ncbi:MAG: SGNH/GDSL hydrolase family protein [Treponema sp.]